MSYKYSPIDAIEKQLLSIESKLGALGILLTPLKELPYGLQVEGEGAESRGKCTLYFSKKKGCSFVDISNNEISQAIGLLYTGEEVKTLGESPSSTKPFRPIIGSDEAGKGDFFGPLCTASFFIETEEMEKELLEIGIRDSKKLTDAKIKIMAKKIREKWPNHFVVVAPKVEKYNNLYSTIGNLNKLLGWMHGRAIFDLYKHFKEKNITVQEAVVDKFGDLKNITQSMGGLDELPISAVVRGEEAEVAIAAASVIARDTFLTKMYFLAKDFDTEIPFGANKNVITAGKKFIQKHGRDKLDQVVKTHFKTIHQL